MKASELIEKLSEFIKIHGDLDVYGVTPGDVFSVSGDARIDNVVVKTIEYYEGYQRGDPRKDFLAFSIETE